MPTAIAFPNDPHAYDMRVTLDKVRYKFQVRWNWRTEDWRLTVIDVAAGTFLATNRRISSGSMIVDFPKGELYAFGLDPYTRKDLGVTISVLYFTDEELTSLRLSSSLGADPSFTLV